HDSDATNAEPARPRTAIHPTFARGPRRYRGASRAEAAMRAVALLLVIAAGGCATRLLDEFSPAGASVDPGESDDASPAPAQRTDGFDPSEPLRVTCNNPTIQMPPFVPGATCYFTPVDEVAW